MSRPIFVFTCRMIAAEPLGATDPLLRSSSPLNSVTTPWIRPGIVGRAFTTAVPEPIFIPFGSVKVAL